MRCEKLGVTFISGGKQIEALRGLSFETQPGEFLSIVGPSGAGKTTLLRTLAGLLEPNAGYVTRPDSGRTILVRQENNVFPWLTVLQNASFGLEMQGVRKAERERRALSLLERFGLAGREHDYPKDLSVGMKQRVAMVQAFVTEPALLLMDEPFAGLDCQTRWQVQGELLELWEQQSHRTVILVTHDVDEALRMSDRILVLSPRPGKVITELKIPFRRPREISLFLTQEFLDIKRFVLAQLGFSVEEVSNASSRGA